jgi:hypothetical protein
MSDIKVWQVLTTIVILSFILAAIIIGTRSKHK